MVGGGEQGKSGRSLLPLREAGRYVALAVTATAAGLIAALLLSNTGEEGLSSRPETAAGQLVRLKSPEILPDIAFSDGHGTARHLSEWRGKAVLLNLWATWCAPCKTEMPSLDRLQAKLAGGNFTVIALSTDRTGPKAPAAFFSQEGIAHLKPYNDMTGQANAAARAEGLPMSLLLNEDGKEIARLLGPADWDSPKMIGQIQRLIRPGAG